MRKKTILLLYLLALISSGIAVIALLFPFVPLPTLLVYLLNRYQPVEFVIALVLFFVASVLGLIAWIGALVKQGKQQQWGWFVCTLLFGGIVLLIYLIAVPERSLQLPVPGYGPVYQPQPPMYYPPNQPSYPSSPNDPRS